MEESTNKLLFQKLTDALDKKAKLISDLANIKMQIRDINLEIDKAIGSSKK